MMMMMMMMKMMMMMMIRLTGACWAQRGLQAPLGLQAQRGPHVPLMMMMMMMMMVLVMMMMVMMMMILRLTGACWAQRGLQAPLGLQAQRGPEAPQATDELIAAGARTGALARELPFKREYFA